MVYQQQHPNPKNVVIIGAGMGGLSAAIHLRQGGYDVTVYEANSQPGGRANIIQENGFSFDTGPSLLNYPFVFEELFSTAGRKLSDYVTLLKVEPSVSFLWPDHTQFTLSSDIHRFANECERLEQDSGPNIFRFFAENSFKFNLSFDRIVTKNANSYTDWLSGVGLKSLLRLRLWQSMYRELKRYFKSRYICEALGSYSMYLGGSPFRLPGIFSILPYGELAYGLFLPRGGIYGLVRGIEKLAVELGIVIKTDSPVQKILTQDNQITGIKLNNSEIVNTSIVVSNVDVPTTIHQLLDKNNSQTFKPVIRRNLKMTPSVVTYYWGVQSGIVGMPHHTIFLPNNYRQAFDDLFKKHRIPDELPFYVSVPTETDPSLAPAGHSILFVLVPVPPADQLVEANWENLSNKIEDLVHARMNHHGYSINKKDIVLRKILTPHDWQKKFGLYNGSAFGAAHTLMQMGPGRIKNYHPEIKGLFFTGASTTPGTGLPMVILSGKMTADRIMNHVQ